MAYAEDILKQYGQGFFDKSANAGQSFANFSSGQYGKMTDFMDRYRMGVAKQEALPHMYQRIGMELGIPNLQQSVNTLGKTYAELPQTYGNATRGFDVNANQLARTISTKAGELAPALQSAQQALSGAQQEAQTRTGYGLAQQQKELEPFKTEQQMLSEFLAREQSGFTTGAQMELDGLLQKLQSGIALTEAEKQRAHQLAQLEKQFEYNKQLKAMDIEAQKYSVDKQFDYKNSDPLGLF